MAAFAAVTVYLFLVTVITPAVPYSKTIVNVFRGVGNDSDYDSHLNGLKDSARRYDYNTASHEFIIPPHQTSGRISHLDNHSGKRHHHERDTSPSASGLHFMHEADFEKHEAIPIHEERSDCHCPCSSPVAKVNLVFKPPHFPFYPPQMMMPPVTAAPPAMNAMAQTLMMLMG